MPLRSNKIISWATIAEIDRAYAVASTAWVLALVLLFFSAGSIWPSDQGTKLVEDVATGLIPVSLAFIVSNILLRKYREIRDEGLADEVGMKVTEAIEAQKERRAIEAISFGNDETDWRLLLLGASAAEICLFYISSSWANKNLPIFLDFVKKGGKLTFYLPSPLGITGRFFGNSKPTSDTQKRIMTSYKLIDDGLVKTHPKMVEVIFSDTGFNFMFARITKNSSKSFLISAYPNNFNKIDSPLVAFSEQQAEKIRMFADAEVASLRPAQSTFDYENRQLLSWSDDGRRVFVSSDLHCPLECSFCFVESLKGQRSPQGASAAPLYYYSILGDKRFARGETTIMVGGFNDPFLPKNMEFTLAFLHECREIGNPIHIATRMPVKEKDFSRLAQYFSSVVINYSVSSMRNVGLEPNNQVDRFASAKQMIAAGANVALFVRPVIKDVTVPDLDELIKRAKESGVKVVTVGGLYVDESIRKRLKDKSVMVPGSPYVEKKQHVLDRGKKLKKIRDNDVEVVRKAFEKAEFTVFMDASARVEHFRLR
jgi:DNA repair photolyase